MATSDQRAGYDALGDAARLAAQRMKDLADLMHPERMIHDLNPSPEVRVRTRELMIEHPEWGLLDALAQAEKEIDGGK